MGLLHKGVTILAFDETYDDQKTVQSFTHETINLKNLHHTNLFCEEDSLRKIEAALKRRTQRGITFLGSGNYHYVSSLLLKEAPKPFTLVLFDNHPDMDNGFEQKMLSCGSWVSYALKTNPLLEKVVMIGPTSIQAHFRPPYSVQIFPFTKQHHEDRNLVLSAIHTDMTYISIDKDVLDPDFAETNWDQGVMDKQELFSYIAAILEEKQVFGIDICGETPVSPAERFLPHASGIIRKNDAVNAEILALCLQAEPRHVVGA
ncbi:arginase [Weizmannia acidilactici]|uniref:Arginase n=1 Tax=Weizmannia acidilactici TaxID=2607726 RepID=A0A5J4JIG0_9BACI|nr:arginase family protein [Weizmannia acidilactici]GER66766.1 arginase [Weizmannia acidilactici]GER71059.1 arginase [Weizmannia acidilactici]GER74308.1 arginase [Weizmannia acidilactici]